MLLLEAIFLPANLPFTGLLGLTLLYWLSVIIGALDTEVFDIDFDLDGGEGLGTSLLSFLRLGEVPISVWVSFFALFSWIGSILINHFLNPSGAMFPGFLFWIPLVIGGGLVTKVAVTPFRGLFKGLKGEATSYASNEGKIAQVFTTKLDQNYGQIEIEGQGSPLLVQAVLDEEGSLSRGDKVLVVEHDREKNIYHVVRYQDPTVTGEV